jgi:ABC-type sugar transport system substrate-binding protein
MENDGPWRIAETNSMKAEASKRAANFNLVVTDAQKQTSKQVSDVEDLIARHVDAIFSRRKNLKDSLRRSKPQRKRRFQSFD